VSRPAMLRARLRAALHRKRLRDAENLTREMAVARNIQRDFLPESLPVAMGVQLEAALHPARQVSGDFYDAFTLAPSGTIVMVVGDVCDKGVGAALFMALFRSLIRASADPVGGGAIQMIGGRRTLVRQSLEAATPADLLTRVAGFTNDYIARLHGRTNMFATVFLAALDPMTGHFDTMSVSSAGIATLANDTSFYGLMTDDKKVIFTIDGGINSGDYSLIVITVTGQTYTQADYAGTYNFFAIRNNVPNPGWSYGVSSIDAAGNGTYLSYTDSAGGATPGPFTRLLLPSGVVTDPADATAHGQMSYNKDLAVRTNTSAAGRYGIVIGFKE